MEVKKEPNRIEIAPQSAGSAIIEARVIEGPITWIIMCIGYMPPS